MSSVTGSFFFLSNWSLSLDEWLKCNCSLSWSKLFSQSLFRSRNVVFKYACFNRSPTVVTLNVTVLPTGQNNWIIKKQREKLNGERILSVSIVLTGSWNRLCFLWGECSKTFGWENTYTVQREIQNIKLGFCQALYNSDTSAEGSERASVSFFSLEVEFLLGSYLVVVGFSLGSDPKASCSSAWLD